MRYGLQELKQIKWTAIIMLIALLWTVAGCGKSGNEDDGDKAPGRQRKTEIAQTNAEPNIVMLDKDAVESSQIQTAEVRAGSSLVTTRFPGTIEFNPNATAVVQPPIESHLLEWLVNIGDRVTKDQVLARLENPQNLGASLELKAPLAGEIIERNAMVGDWVKPGDKLAIISELETMWAVARVREPMVGRVLRDGPATIRPLAYPDETFTGKLLRVGARVDPETRTVEFVYSVSNPEHKLRDGMFAEISLATDRIEQGLFVPVEAVQTLNDQPVVFVEL
ncbi:MAG TPA: efflux RND transporter periplasmic adaptor subunit, partial [Candidatus Binatia bacterium]|nr:efflux RND transporter periplasmic adaptor subunit [Candidatus Binatia bacterium]